MVEVAAVAVLFLSHRMGILAQTASQGQIVSKDPLNLLSPYPCDDMIEAHTFTGNCCSLIDNDIGGCDLVVIGGVCQVSGPIWYFSFNSVSLDECPESAYNVLPADGTKQVESSTAPSTSAPPSDLPSLVPSTTQSISASPSVTLFPTKSPIIPQIDSVTTPLTSVLPSDLPSLVPSTIPTTGLPSDAPSLVPTIAPSISTAPSTSALPSDAPSLVPSTTPTSSSPTAQGRRLVPR